MFISSTVKYLSGQNFDVICLEVHYICQKKSKKFIKELVDFCQGEKVAHSAMCIDAGDKTLQYT